MLKLPFSETTLGALLSVLCLRGPLLAQTSTGEIDVIVLDPTDAIISNAEVKIVGAKTGNVMRTLLTNKSGIAVASLLPPELYNVTVALPGFTTLERKDVMLRVSET